jgi:hypothetical protein
MWWYWSPLWKSGKAVVSRERFQRRSQSEINIAARLTVAAEDTFYRRNGWFSQRSLKNKKSRFRKWNDHHLRAGMKTKRKQFSPNGCPCSLCCDSHHLCSWWLLRTRSRQNQMKISNSLLTTNIAQSAIIRKGGKSLGRKITVNFGGIASPRPCSGHTVGGKKRLKFWKYLRPVL